MVTLTLIPILDKSLGFEIKVSVTIIPIIVENLKEELKKLTSEAERR